VKGCEENKIGVLEGKKLKLKMKKKENKRLVKDVRY
jgi:hypothetical protein